MKQAARRAVPYLLIALALLAAFLPVLTNFYIRQDDMKWNLPQHFSPPLRYDYYNAVYELFRPLSVPIFMVTDAWSYHMETAVWVRVFNLGVLIAIAWGIFSWLLQAGYGRKFSASYAVLACTLPSYQIFVATGNYLLMLLGVWLTVLGLPLLWRTVKKEKEMRRFSDGVLLMLGIFLIEAALMIYPLSPMFGWVMVAMLLFAPSRPAKPLKKLLWLSLAFMLAIAAYFVLGKIFQGMTYVNSGGDRALGVSFALWPKLLWLKDAFFWHSQLWFWRGADMLPWFACLVLMMFSGGLVFWRRDMAMRPAWLLFYGIAAATCFALCYAPVIAASNIGGVNFRYTLATMPLLLFLSLWGAWRMAHTLRTMRVFHVLLATACLFFTAYANYQLETRVAGAQAHELAFVREALAREALPGIQEKKPLDVVVACDFHAKRSFEYNHPDFEYGMRMRYYPDQCIAAVVHGLRVLGVDSVGAKSNELIRDEVNDRITLVTPWGRIIAVDEHLSDAEIAYGNNRPPVIIRFADAGEMTPYASLRHFWKR